MRRIIFIAIMALGVLVARAMGYNEARQEALFLTGKMAYELGLNQAQYDAVYEINFDYFMAVSTQKNIKGTYLNRRNYDIKFVLTTHAIQQVLQSRLLLYPGNLEQRHSGEDLLPLPQPQEDVLPRASLIPPLPRGAQQEI